MDRTAETITVGGAVFGATVDFTYRLDTAECARRARVGPTGSPISRCWMC
ncbi:hypothetical protein [Nocardia gipuzkoensis]|nr:hypothetical protein [Nocardia gipuzkoensis]MDE1674369.1 hypothetical protein [Nocardia gipuzkoensis]